MQVKVSLPEAKVGNPPDQQATSPPAGLSPQVSSAQVIPESTSPAPAPLTIALPPNRKIGKRTGSGSESKINKMAQVLFLVKLLGKDGQ